MRPQRYKLVLEYDGTNFAGWQIQPGQRTVQGELERALAQLFQEEIPVTASGRTDAGVHALMQVVHFDAHKRRSLDNILRGLNTILPDDMAVLAAEPVSPEFHARFSAVRRQYRYQIIRRPTALLRHHAYFVRDELNLHDMQRCAELLEGEHDFQAFCSAQAEVNHYLCEVFQAGWQYEKPELLVFTITANRFLHNMVRILVGTMLEVGRGKFTVPEFEKLLLQKDRTQAGGTAPPHGLFLESVVYEL